ncbi:hypothetical protein MGG_00367 [Pyricularia oryzae 70-15]|uniref:Uncharacterized protein n=3 Tax=Pyricularia oryzae TaxID=318829 RepID=G4NCN4_PYRO7|nr:uncharacterized protein MGG_00367 [Pyricularia oryzae 70-15]EHA49128.1 hypothetical protein MGG_00367 [Pyricularia oryzae 70-15]ELQ42669.1 hypothetical protein OOU_Y34scaffold00198g10 [Pyricularia oryzae Y34]
MITLTCRRRRWVSRATSEIRIDQSVSIGRIDGGEPVNLNGSRYLERRDLALIAQSLLLIMWEEVKQQRKRRPGLAPAGEQWNEAGRLQTLKHLHHWARSQLTASSKSGFIKVPGCQETVWGVIRLWAVTAGTGNVSLAGRCPLSGLGRHTGQVTIMLATNGRL